MAIINGIAAQSLAALLAALSSFNNGMIYGWPSPSIPKLLAGDSDLPLTSDQSSWVVSFLSIGNIFAPLLVVHIVDHIGRKSTLILSTVPMLASWLMIGLATNYQWLYAARFFGGFGIGIVLSTISMYSGEVVEDRIRGRLSSMIYILNNTGILTTWIIGPWISRQMLALASAIPVIIFMITFFWMPESPYYYLMKGNRDAARSSLLWLRRRSDVEDELMNMERSVHMQQQNRANALQLLTNLGNRRAFIITIGLFTFQQLSGLSAISSYVGTIFAHSGSSISSEISAVIVGVVKLSSGIITLVSVDKFGRRPVLLFSTIGTSLSLFAEAVFFDLQSRGRDVSSFTWLPLVGIMGFYILFTCGMGSLVFVIAGEVFPTNIKASASMMIATYSAVLGLLVMKLYQDVVDAFGIHAVFYGFATFTTIGISFNYFCVPETKNRPLQEIQDMLNRRKPSTENNSKDSRIRY